MKMIYKYEFRILDIQGIDMPKGAKILCVQDQRGVACLWAEVDNEKPSEKRLIQVVGTGQPISTANRFYIGTIQQTPLVWHVFEIKESNDQTRPKRIP